MKKRIIACGTIFVAIFSVSLLLNLNDQYLGNYDRIWLFMEAKKMTEGFMIYRDFNALVGPVFFHVYSLFMRIFGINYITSDIYGSAQCGIIAVLTYLLTTQINKTRDPLITLTMFLVSFHSIWEFRQTSYNNLVLETIMLVMMIDVGLSQKKLSSPWWHVLIGVILGIGFYTKQTVAGIAILGMLAVPMIDGIWIHKHNPMKEIVPRLCGLMSVIILGMIVMLIRGNFVNYIDLCFGGILEFGQKNTTMGKLRVYSILMLGILLSGVLIIKELKQKEELIPITVYALASCAFLLPIANTYHIHMALFLTWFLVIEIVMILQEHQKKELGNLFLTILVVTQMVSLYAKSGSMTASDMVTSGIDESYMLVLQIMIKVMLCAWGWALVKERPHFLKSAFLVCILVPNVFYLYNFTVTVKENPVPEGLEIYAHHGFNQKDLEEIKQVVSYMQDKESQGFKTLMVAAEASKYTTAMNRNQNQFDLFNQGNLGYHGTEKALNEIKEMHHTLILKSKSYFWQTPAEVLSYIETLPLYEELEEFEVYIKD